MVKKMKRKEKSFLPLRPKDLRPQTMTFEENLAISFHLRWSDHEKAVGALARRLGFTQVSLSSEVMPMVRAVPRGYTVCADAYLTPKIREYLKGFTSGFKGALKVCSFA